MRRLAVVPCALAFVLAASACAPHRAPPERTLRLAFSERLNSLDPIYLSGANGSAIDALAFSFLLRPRPDGTLVPDIALAEPTLGNGGIARDGRTITYHLKRGVRWQDGAPLTSADVAFTIRALQNPRNTIGSRDPYDRIERVETPDVATLRVRVRTPDAAIVGLLLTPDTNAAILPSHLLARYASLDRVPFASMPLGSGPYRVTRWTRGASVRFEADRDYFAGTPHLPALELRYVPDTTTTLVQLRTGELDGVLGADPALFARYRELPDARVTNVPYTGATALVFNVERAPLASRTMRRALAMAVDAATLARETYRGAVPASDASRGLFSYADDPAAPWPRFDPAAASRALDKLGWTRASSGVRRKDGRDLELRTIFSNASVANGTAAVLLQQQFARAGVRLVLQPFLATQLYATAMDGGPLARGRFDVALVAYSANVDPDETWLVACRERAPQGFDWARYCSADADAFSHEASRAFDRHRRITLVRALERTVATDVPFLPLWRSREIDVLPRELAGFEPNGALPYASASNWRFLPAH
ncbi:MAG: peptide ABC transporter substrate-binding protein [Candidatus Eremiobacteraeota bacterium]|nr:peptide ABC transporter substrate-binding protein [Candidatus Eremiobacteraeota bacterium]